MKNELQRKREQDTINMFMYYRFAAMNGCGEPGVAKDWHPPMVGAANERAGKLAKWGGTALVIWGPHN